MSDTPQLTNQPGEEAAAKPRPAPQKAQPPYPIIANALLDGEVVPFLGAGVNYGVLPIGAELSRSLAKECSFPSDKDSDLEDLAKVSSYFVEVGSRLYLRRYLRRTFCGGAAAGGAADAANIHTYLAGLGKPLVIVTTNYDDLTETAFKRMGRPYDLVIHPTDRREWEAAVLWWEDLGLNPEEDAKKKPKAVKPNELHIELSKKTVIYKMHGTVHRQRSQWDSYVITEDDYVEFLARMTGQTAVPAQFMHHFQQRRFLFLGYGLRDWNFRVVLRNLRTVLQPKKGGQSDWTELYEELSRVNAAVAETFRQGFISPAQAAKILEISEQQLDGVPDDDEDDDDLVGGADQGPSWAVQYEPTDLERRLWERRGIQIYDVEIGEFARQLQDATAEVRQRPEGGAR